MGSCVSNSSRDPTHNQIEQHLLKDEQEEKEHKKLLLLGTASSGKSTILKQLHYIHGPGDHPYNEISELTQIIRQNIINAMIKLLRQSQILYDSDPHQFQHCLIDATVTKTRLALQCLADALFQITLSQSNIYSLVFGYIHRKEDTLNLNIPPEITRTIVEFCYYDALFENENDMKQIAESVNALWELEAVQYTFAERGNKFLLSGNIN
eukprot:227495_1